MSGVVYLRRRGFSLIEIVIVLFITGIILFCVGGLTDKTFQTLRFLQEKSRTLDSATMACDRLSAELREAVTAPTLGDDVSFYKVIPSVPQGVGNVPGTDPGGWQRSYTAGQRANIVYKRVGETVIRQVNSEPALEVANYVNAFNVSQPSGSPAGNYMISLSIVEARRVLVFVTYVSCPGVPR